MLHTMMMSGGLLLFLVFNCLVPTHSASSTPSPPVVFQCRGARCPAGQDCINVSGRSRCADPCEHYSVLNDAWRATNTSVGRSSHCDRSRSWNGWYRMFLGHSSVKMPEACVEKRMCGTHAPLWLTTPHPGLADGVQQRKVCGHWSGGCCAFRSNPIHVKACAGNYYVYKFVKPTVCNLAYCADVNTTVVVVSGPALAALMKIGTRVMRGKDWQWGKQDGLVPGLGRIIGELRGGWIRVRWDTGSTNRYRMGYGGQYDLKLAGPLPTPPPTPPSTISPGGPIPVLNCWRNSMEVGLSLAQLSSAGLDPFSAHLVDRRCSPNVNRNSTMWYQVERTEGTCGNTLSTNGSYAVYSNSLFVYPLRNVSMVQPLTIPFSCTYPLETDASLDVAIAPYLLRIRGGLSGAGPKARASMSLFHNARYTESYPAGRVLLPMGAILYVGVSVEEIEIKHFVVVMENCYATHTANPEDLMRYFLIQRKCPTDRRQVEVTESGLSLKARFSALFFLFQGDYRDFFLHCSLSLCDKEKASCTPKCSGRRRRDVSESLLKPVTIGPISWDQTME